MAMFERIKRNIIGDDCKLPSGKRMLYMDWTASGRLYGPIESLMINEIGPLVANTHTETSYSGRAMTQAYHQARQQVKDHIHANEGDALLFCGTGMTGAIHKFQRMLGLRNGSYAQLDSNSRPLVIVTHMEHHSNHTSWLECDVEVAVLKANESGFPCQNHLTELMQGASNRPWVLGAFSACSNVTGAHIPYQELGAVVKQHGGYLLVDFAASAPYVDMNMHPKDGPDIDVLVFSPHKFLGGPGSAGVLAFNKSLYRLDAPEAPGGGTVKWTNPWGGHRYYDDIEVREDGGTPGFLQAMRVALCIQLKEQMGTDKIAAIEQAQVDALLPWMKTVPGLNLLAAEHTHRLAVFSLYFDNLHYNLVVRLLNDRYGIQARGGCACAGTYGHWLLNVDEQQSKEITDRIDQGDLSMKPGWVRISLHPTTGEDEIEYLKHALAEIAEHGEVWAQDYYFDASSADYLPVEMAREKGGKLGENEVSWLVLPNQVLPEITGKQA